MLSQTFFTFLLHIDITSINCEKFEILKILKIGPLLTETGLEDIIEKIRFNK